MTETLLRGHRTDMYIKDCDNMIQGKHLSFGHRAILGKRLNFGHRAI